MKITEIKRHIDGRVEEFVCDVVELKNDSAIVHHIWNRDEHLIDGPFSLPAGEIHTQAYFWSDRNYLIYAISTADGELLGHRFDICENVHISSELISFDDLELDLWVDRENNIHVLDEADVEAHVKSGRISLDQLELIDETKSFLVENHHQVIRNLKR